MARKKQQLINYHTSGVTNMPQVEDVALGEIVVRHATDKPELLIKKDNNQFATFIDSTSINGKLDALKTYIDGQIDSLESASTSDLKAFSATVVNTYATSADTESAIATAKSEAVSSGKGYTDGQISAVTSAYKKADADLASSIKAVSGSVSAFSATVVNDYATKVMASGYAMTAEANAVASGKGYTDGQISAVTSAYTKADTELENKITSLSGSVSALSEELKSEIADKVSSAYIYKGSVSDVSNLPSTGNVKGDVYNVINANGAPGDKNYTPAGTNYAWDGEKWDALGGIVDLSNYATTANTESAIATAKSEAVSSGKGYTDGQISAITSAYTKADADLASSIKAVSGSVSAFSATVVNTYATSANTESAIATAKSEAVSSGKGYTDGQISAITSAYTQADNDLDARIDKLEAISAHTQSAVQNVVVANTDANKITATKTDKNNLVTLNFDNMVIDCGDF